MANTPVTRKLAAILSADVQGYAALQVYHQEHSDWLVPARHTTPSGYRLGSWVAHQRSGKDTLAAERIKRLDALGFVWDARRKAV